MEPKYWAFISYSHADKKWADWLHRELETYLVPSRLVGRETERGYKTPKRLFPIFRDREELPGSSDLGSTINAALKQSRYLVVICSPRAAASRWVNEEIVTFKSLGREDRVLAIIVDGEPNASDRPAERQLECFPPGLRFQVGPDRQLLPVPTEPIAADVRPGKDGRDKAKLKLVAGVLGVGFDELAQRERQRQLRRTALLVLSSVIVAVAIYGFYQFQEAQDEKRLKAQQADADLRAKQLQVESQKKLEEQRAEAALKQKQLADQHQAENETKLGSASLLAGNDHDAATHLAAAYRLQPQNRSVQVMLGAAMKNLGSLASDQESGLGDPVQASENIGKSLLLTRGDASWKLFDLGSGKLVKASEPSRPGADEWQGVELSPSGDSLVLLYKQKVRLESLSGAPPRDLKPPGTDGILTNVFPSYDESKIYGSLLLANQSQLLSWDVNTGACTVLLVSPVGQEDSLLTVSADGTRAVVIRAAAPTPGQPMPPAVLASLNLADGSIVSSMPLNGYSHIDRSPDGTQLLRTNYGTAPMVYSAEGQPLFSLSPPGDAVLNVHWNPSGKTLLSRNHNSVTLWDTATGSVLTTWPNVAPGECVMDPAEHYLATVSRDTPAAIYERSSGLQVATLPGVTHVTAFSPDGSKLFDVGQRARIWDWKSSRPSMAKFVHHKQAIDALAFDSTGSRLAAVSDDRSASVWDIAKGQITCATAPAAQTDFDFTQVAFCPDGKSILTSASRLGASPSVLWDAATGQQEQQIFFQHQTSSSPGETMTANVPAAYASLPAHGLIAGLGNLVAEWDRDAGAADMGQPSRVITLLNFTIRSLALNPAQDLFAAASDSGTVRIGKVATGDLVCELPGDQAIQTLEFGAAGQVLTLDAKGICRLWSVADPKNPKTLNPDGAFINDAHFLSNGAMVVTGDVDGKAQIWDAREGKPIGAAMLQQAPASEDGFDLPPPIDPHAAVIRQGLVAVGATPDGALVAGALSDGNVCLWSREDGMQLLRHKIGETFTAFGLSPNGHLVALGTNTGDIFLWDISPEQRSPDEIDAALKKVVTPTPSSASPATADSIPPPPPLLPPPASSP
jgi:WD40 repeat protein